MAEYRGVLLLAACWIGLPASNSALATDPTPAVAKAASDHAADQQSRARELIILRAKSDALARSVRMSARKRAGISLLRPVRSTASFGTVMRVRPIDHGIRSSR